VLIPLVGKKFNIELEGWHTESGPGVYEAALEYGEIRGMADRASLFKYAVKALGTSYGITPCFMAKPVEGLPGNSGHMHISLTDSNGNVFARTGKNSNPTFSDLAYISDVGEHFLAGILDGLPSIMPLLAPTINSYKRLVENFWAPVTVSWGLEHRAASVRVISPPTASPKATRFEIRTPGADANPHYVLAAILGCGLRGVEKKLKMTIPPMGKGEEMGGGERLAKNLGEAVNKMAEKGSVAREVFGDAFVDHFAGTRRHELRLWEQAVTDWEMRRYIETV
jgi:glutamine synthetase